MILSNDFIVFWPQSVLWFYRSHGSSWLVTSFTPSKLKLNGNTAILMNYIKIHSTMVQWSLVIGFMGNSYDMTHDDVPRRRPKTYIYYDIYIMIYIYYDILLVIIFITMAWKIPQPGLTVTSNCPGCQHRHQVRTQPIASVHAPKRLGWEPMMRSSS